MARTGLAKKTHLQYDWLGNATRIDLIIKDAARGGTKQKDMQSLEV